MTALRVVLGDQLSADLSALAGPEADPKRDIVLMAEVAEECGYVPHHRKKIAFILASMRAFASELQASGWRVIYFRLDDEAAPSGLNEAVSRTVAAVRPDRIVCTHAGEHRVLAMQKSWRTADGCPAEIREDDRFLCTPAMFAQWAHGRAQLRMEYFYREMRRRTGLLMVDGQPAGGRWNFDSENRKPANGAKINAHPARFEPDDSVRSVTELVARRFPDGYGDIEPFWLAVRRKDALEALEAFMAESLPLFGDHQDAMLEASPFLHHAFISAYLNVGLLSPLEVCRRAEDEWKAGRAPINAVEGFIRQIIGWREFVRGVYWLEGPDYLRANALDARRPLPAFYWNGRTEMNCMKACLAQTRTEAYAHHIQRLMVTGNFALLCGIDPAAVHEWYLSVYIDAFEWVEAPNTLGMSLYADGGRFASKPYAAGGAYINRMSDYCRSCAFDVRKRTGEGACPFNALYWDFIARHEERLAGNPRCAQIVRSWRAMAPGTRTEIRAQAQDFLARLDAGQSDAGV